MSAVVSVEARLVTEACCNCGVLFAMPEDLKNELFRRKASRSFYCPNGHGQHYTGESDDAKIRRLEASLTAERDQHAATARTLRRTQTELRNVHRRVDHGVCPHCHRTFANVARHMKARHPDVLEAAR